MTTVVATRHPLRVSTRRMDNLVMSLRSTGFSKSKVSEMAKDPGEQVAAFRTRPPDEGYGAECGLATLPHPRHRESDGDHSLKAQWGWVKALLHTIYDQSDCHAGHAQFVRPGPSGRVC